MSREVNKDLIVQICLTLPPTLLACNANHYLLLLPRVILMEWIHFRPFRQPASMSFYQFMKNPQMIHPNWGHTDIFFLLIKL